MNTTLRIIKINESINRLYENVGNTGSSTSPSTPPSTPTTGAGSSTSPSTPPSTPPQDPNLQTGQYPSQPETARERIERQRRENAEQREREGARRGDYQLGSDVLSASAQDRAKRLALLAQSRAGRAAAGESLKSYTYSGLSPTGKRMSGEIQGFDPQDAIRQLKRIHTIFPTNITSRREEQTPQEDDNDPASRRLVSGMMTTTGALGGVVGGLATVAAAGGFLPVAPAVAAVAGSAALGGYAGKRFIDYLENRHTQRIQQNRQQMQSQARRQSQEMQPNTQLGRATALGLRTPEQEQQQKPSMSSRLGRIGRTVAGGVIGAIPGLMLGGIPGAVIGAGIGAKYGNRLLGGSNRPSPQIGQRPMNESYDPAKRIKLITESLNKFGILSELRVPTTIIARGYRAIGGSKTVNRLANLSMIAGNIQPTPLSAGSDGQVGKVYNPDEGHSEHSPEDPSNPNRRRISYEQR